MTDLGELSKEATPWRFTETIQALAKAADKAITFDVCTLDTWKDAWSDPSLASSFFIESCMREAPILKRSKLL